MATRTSHGKGDDMRVKHARSQADRAERTRHFVAAFIGVVVFNALFALIHTLEANSSFGGVVVGPFDSMGFLAVGAIFLGAYVVGYERGSLLGVVLFVAGALTQAHMFFVQPWLLGWHGGWYFAVDAAVVIVIVYDILLRMRLRRDARAVPVAEVVLLRTNAAQTHDRRAA